jgi:antirestriction protein ArdC
MNVYEIVTQRILEELDKGIVPWRKPWTGSSPLNITGREYRGMNILLLGYAPFSSPVWMSYKQAAEHGGHVKAGEKSSLCVFWKISDLVDDEGKLVLDDRGKPKRSFLLRYYNVFNLDQTEAVALPKRTADKVKGKINDPISAADEVARKMPQPPEIIPGQKASYSPEKDKVSMPDLKYFESAEEYYSTLFHEFTHATGHPTRLNRPSIVDSATFGSGEYGEEELIAEFGAAFLCCETGINNERTDQNNAAYIAGWKAKIKANSHLAAISASRAQKAADFILARPAYQGEQEEKE